MPFGSIGTREFGTYFIGYAADPGVTDRMLHNMFIGNPPGNQGTKTSTVKGLGDDKGGG